MFISDWFDTTNLDHLRAYKHLVDTGCWPEGFIPDDVEIPAGWIVGIMAKLANAFVEMKLDDFTAP